MIVPALAESGKLKQRLSFTNFMQAKVNIKEFKPSLINLVCYKQI